MTGNRPTGHDQWTVWDGERENAHHFDQRGAAEDKLDMAADLGIDADLYPPGESPDALFGADVEVDDGPEPAATDGGQAEPVEAEVVDYAPESGDHAPEYDDLPERSVGEDPIDWVPSEFVDHIDGSPAINRKGFEVLSHFYDVDVASTVEVAPEVTDHEYARVKAVATTDDGRECEAHGSAHVDRGDDHYLLLEMADTRARKRALSIATGVGAVAVEELRNEVEQ